MHIAIAGNIGSGKTTLATLLARQLKFKVEYEDPTTNPYLSDFYKDMNRWGFHLQVYFLNSRLRQAIAIQQSGSSVVQDRTIFEDAYIFAPHLENMGSLSQRDYECYKSLFDSVVGLVRPPDLIIYLRASISTLVDQIASRGRDYEDSIRLDYLRKLNERYEEWFQYYQTSKIGRIVDVNVDELKFHENPEHLGVILNRVRAELFGLFT